MSALFRLIAFLCCLLIPQAASAHKFWIEPERFNVQVNTQIIAAMRVGNRFSGARFPYLSNRFIAFTVTDSTGSRNLDGNEGDDPAISLTPSRPGLTAISYYSTGDVVTFDNNWQLFEEYLAEEGLERIGQRHRERGLPTDQFSETYFRCAKALVQVGAPRPDDADRSSGMPLEWIAEENPYTKAPGGTLRVKLVWNGRPYRDATIIIQRRLDRVSQSTARTDADGSVTIPLESGGVFLINAVHMRPAPADSDSVWESHWASLTFSIRPGEPSQEAGQ